MHRGWQITKPFSFCADFFGYIVHTAFFHLALELTDNKKPQFLAALPAASAEANLTVCTVEELTTENIDRAI